MTRAIWLTGGLIVGFALGTMTMISRAQDPDPLQAVSPAEIAHAAALGGVDEVDLAGAVVSTGLSPMVYLRSVGELEHPLPPPVAAPPAPPPASGVSSRVECIIAKESGGANVANSRGSGAVGVAQYLPSTFAAHAREMGHLEWSPWNPDQARAVAAWDLAHGRRAQWTVGGC